VFPAASFHERLALFCDQSPYPSCSVRCRLPIIETFEIRSLVFASPMAWRVFNIDHTPLIRIWQFAAAYSLAEVATMADENTPSNSSASNVPSRICESCDAEMTHLSDLPSYLGRAAIRIFRCYICNNVVSEDR